MEESKKKVMNMIRGSKRRITGLESRFWNKYPEFLFDDPEEDYNELNGYIRRLAQNYFRLSDGNTCKVGFTQEYENETI